MPNPSALDRQIANQPFWSLPTVEAVKILQTDHQIGISDAESVRRVGVFGLNVFDKIHRSSGWTVLLGQFKSPLIIILLVASLMTILTGHFNDAVFILAAIAANVTLGFYQENKAEKALASLKTYLRPRTRVIRDGIEREMDAADLVPGDLVRLSQGDRVPADLRLIYANDLCVDEAILTGEALPATKTVNPSAHLAGIGDQRSMAFAGTLVTQGMATAVVCRTGFATELGKIAVLVANAKREDTPLQAAIARFGFWASIVLGAMTLAVFALGVVSGRSIAEMFLISVAVAVAAVPEGLPVAMTVILAIGVERMAKRKAVVRKLVAAETLGSTTVILTDKTGTLTMAKMKLSELLPISGVKSGELLEDALLNTDVVIENHKDSPEKWRLSGRSIETALVQSAGSLGILADKVKKSRLVQRSLPFNAVSKYSVSLVGERGDQLVFLGAPDVLVRKSVATPEVLAERLKTIHSLAVTGELVLGVAVKSVKPGPDSPFAGLAEANDLEFRGFITLRDPIRPTAKEAVRRIGAAGVRVVIVTGDHRGTAEAIAKEVGLEIGDGSVIDALELHSLSDSELAARLPKLKVVSRVSPVDKMRIAKLFQAAGEVVAMTGDGVNDAPSLKQADIGIAMGSGTEVARDVADLVILDDNFETIAAAVYGGRQILGNVRKVITYLLSSVTDELLLIGGALLVGLPLPLSAIQILFVNFFTDSFPAIAFAFEKNLDGPASRAQGIKKGLFDPLMKFLILYVGFFTSLFLFALYWILLRLGFPEDSVKTFMFASFGTYSLFLALSLRSLSASIFSYSFFSNRYLLAGIGAGLALVSLAIYVPFFNSLFGTVPLGINWVLGVLGIGILNILAVEFGKWLFHRRR